MAVIDPAVVIAAQTLHPLDGLPPIFQLDRCCMNPCPQAIADQPRGHRVDVVRHSHRAPARYRYPLLPKRLHPAQRKPPHRCNLLSQPRPPLGVALDAEQFQKSAVFLYRTKIPARSESKPLVQGTAKPKMRLLHIAVLVRLAHPDLRWLHPVVSQQLHIPCVETPPVTVPQLMGRRR